MLWKGGFLISNHLINLFLGQTSCFSKVHTSQVGPSQVGPSQVGPSKIGSFEACHEQVCTLVTFRTPIAIRVKQNEKTCEVNAADSETNEKDREANEGS